jgi:nicotinate-nucleotide adenylyltransferase
MALARAGIDDFELDKVLWVLTHSPPHKPDDPISSLDSRREMVVAAIKDHPGFEFSRIDIDRPSPHYAIGTMQGLREKYPDDRFLYLMGEDSLRDLPTWHNPAEFIDLCDILGVMHRSDIEVDLQALGELLPGIGDKVRFSQTSQVHISSTDIRRRVRGGVPYEHLVPHAVAHLIHELGLYK